MAGEPELHLYGWFGLGPANPVTAWDDKYWLWVRSVAISDGADTVVLTILDGEGYCWDYPSKYDECGVKQLSATLGQEWASIRPGSSSVRPMRTPRPISAGGWGFVPDWYMRQVTEEQQLTWLRAYVPASPDWRTVATIGADDVSASGHQRPADGVERAGFFDRQFAARPSSVRTGKSPDTAPCALTSVNSAEVAVGVVRIAVTPLR